MAKTTSYIYLIIAYLIVMFLAKIVYSYFTGSKNRVRIKKSLKVNGIKAAEKIQEVNLKRGFTLLHLRESFMNIWFKLTIHS